MERIESRNSIPCLIGIALVLFGGLPSALAQTGDIAGQDRMDEDVTGENEEDHERMLELSAEGNELYEAGQFEEAAEIYQEAYETYPQAILLKNQMITRYLIEECERAVELGEKYLEVGEPSEQDREEVEAVFGECSLDLAEAAVESENWTEADEWLQFGDPYLFEAQLRERAEELRGRVESRRAEKSDVEPPENPGMSTREMAGWGTGAVGVATLLGAGLWHGSWEMRVARGDDLTQDQYETVSWAIPMMYGVGATAAAAGAGLLLWPAIAGGDESAAMIGPDVGSDRAGAVLTISF